MTNYQECTTQWQNLEEILRHLKITMRKRREYDQVVQRRKNVEGYERLQLWYRECDLSADLSMDDSYYRVRAHDLDGIKIAQNQITFAEFEALLYFAKVTGEDRTKWFYDFASVYPCITYAWDKRNAA